MWKSYLHLGHSQEMPFCVKISFVFYCFYMCLISFIKIKILWHRLNYIVNCVFLLGSFQTTENSILPKYQIRTCCIHKAKTVLYWTEKYMNQEMH